MLLFSNWRGRDFIEILSIVYWRCFFLIHHVTAKTLLPYSLNPFTLSLCLIKVTAGKKKKGKKKKTNLAQIRACFRASNSVKHELVNMAEHGEQRWFDSIITHRFAFPVSVTAIIIIHIYKIFCPLNMRTQFIIFQLTATQSCLILIDRFQ